MKNLTSIRILGFLAAALTTAPSYAIIHFSLLGGVNQAKPDVQGRAETTPPTTMSFNSATGYAGGASIEATLTRGLGLEVGALYAQRKFDQIVDVPSASANITTNFQGNALEIPVLARFWLGRFISIGAGGYYAKALGNVKYTSVTSVAGASVTGSGSGSYSDYGLKTSDLGLLGSVRLSLPIGMLSSFVVDGRYAYGLSDGLTADGKSATSGPAANLYGSGATLKHRELQVLAGFRFGLGK